MRISELARAGGVPVATVKYYLRERLLPEGELTSPTQARYDAGHVARLRLVRALLGPGGLSVARAREVLRAIDDPPESAYDLLGVAAQAIGASDPSGPADHPEVHALMERWGWPVEELSCGHHQALATALRALDDAGFEPPEGLLDLYAAHIGAIGEAELAHTPTDSPAAAVRYVILGTVLMEPLLLALRRMVHEAAAARQFGPRPGLPPGLRPAPED